jgi:hypothetical protein
LHISATRNRGLTRAFVQIYGFMDILNLQQGRGRDDAEISTSTLMGYRFSATLSVVTKHGRPIVNFNITYCRRHLTNHKRVESIAAGRPTGAKGRRSKKRTHPEPLGDIRQLQAPGLNPRKAKISPNGLGSQSGCLNEYSQRARFC